MLFSNLKQRDIREIGFRPDVGGVWYVFRQTTAARRSGMTAIACLW